MSVERATDYGDEVLWTRVVGSENLLSSWLNASLLLLGNALIFYHMANTQTIEASKPVAGLIATAFVLTSLAILLSSIRAYYLRAPSAAANLPEHVRVVEKSAARQNLRTTIKLQTQ